MARIREGSSRGKLMMLIGLLVAAPLVLLGWYPQDAGLAPAFAGPAAVSLVAGALVCLFGRREGGASVGTLRPQARFGGQPGR
ncbi:MAG: hypothetical protein ACI4OI_00520, partial [Gemmiger sp.]